MSRYLKSSNPFEDDEEEPDKDFVMVGNKQNAQSTSTKDSSFRSSQDQAQNNVSRYSSNTHYHDEENSPFEDRRRQLMMQIDNSENTQLDSTQRALASIYESEAMGVATAEELLRQGETLNNIEKKTGDMQQNLTVSQKHLNNIKSVFGGIKNWWSKDKKPEDSKSTANSSTRLKAEIEKTNNQPSKSKPDVRGFYEDDDNDDLDSKFMAGARKPGSVGGSYQFISPVTRSAREEEIDSNLGDMCEGMSRLKGLAMGLGDEIERQTDQLDRIDTKVNKTDDLLSHQNVQMRKILRK